MFGKKKKQPGEKETLSLQNQNEIKTKNPEIETSETGSSFLKKLVKASRFLLIGLIALSALGALAAAARTANPEGDDQNGIFSKLAETIGLKEANTSDLFASTGAFEVGREYIDAGSEKRAIEDYDEDRLYRSTVTLAPWNMRTRIDVFWNQAAKSENGIRGVPPFNGLSVMTGITYLSSTAATVFTAKITFDENIAVLLSVSFNSRNVYCDITLILLLTAAQFRRPAVKRQP